jgi:hypothetical protein
VKSKEIIEFSAEITSLLKELVSIITWLLESEKKALSREA